MCQQPFGWLEEKMFDPQGPKSVIFSSLKKKIGDFPVNCHGVVCFFGGGDRLVDSSPDAPGLFWVSFPWHDLEKKTHPGKRLL